MKTLIGGIVAGLVVWFWGFIAHMVLPIGEMGLSVIPPERESAVLGALKSGLPGSGLYFFPGMKMDGTATEEETAAFEAKYREGPHGLLAYTAEGAEPLSPRNLITQLLSDILCGLVAAFLLTQIRGSFGGRVLAVTLLGVFAWLEVTVPQWKRGVWG